jgi:hypothetical protein
MRAISKLWKGKWQMRARSPSPDGCADARLNKTHSLSLPDQSEVRPIQ